MKLCLTDTYIVHSMYCTVALAQVRRACFLSLKLVNSFFYAMLCNVISEDSVSRSLLLSHSLALSQFPLDFASAVNYCQITVDANEAYIKYRFRLEKK